MCRLKAQVKANPGTDRGRLFESIKVGDVVIIKRVMEDFGLGYATWHGSRRGRLPDLTQVGGLEGSVSFDELLASGGWHLRPRALFTYAESGVLHVNQLIHEVAAGSDTDYGPIVLQT